jgi:hypothetical protein
MLKDNDLNYLLDEFDKIIYDKAKNMTVGEIKTKAYKRGSMLPDIPHTYDKTFMLEIIMQTRIQIMLNNGIIDNITADKLLKKIGEYNEIEYNIAKEYIHVNFNGGKSSQNLEALYAAKQEYLLLFEMYHLNDQLPSMQEIISNQVKKTYNIEEPKRNR